MGFQFAGKSKKPAQHKSSASPKKTLGPISPAHPVLQLQRTIGNHGVLRLLDSQRVQTKCACGGGCHRCRGNFKSRTDLKVSQPGDKYEREADRVADQVMRMPDLAIDPRGKMAEEEQIVQSERTADRGAVPAQKAESSEVLPPIVHEVLNSSGQSLDPEARSFMQPRFGFDFSGVRVHSDGEAAKLNRGLGSQAFTHQRSIYFAAGKYRPETASGRRLLAHELTHVLQQSGGTNATRQHTRSTQSAERVSASAVSGHEGTDLVQCKKEEDYTKRAEIEEVAHKVSDALSEQDPEGGVGDIDKAYRILNKQTSDDLPKIFSQLLKRGHFHGLLGNLASGTQASDKLILAIRVFQCEKVPSSLTLAAIKQAESLLAAANDGTHSKAGESAAHCFQREGKRVHEEVRIQTLGIRKGTKALTHGTMTWNLEPKKTGSRSDFRGQATAKMQISFLPGPKYKGETVTFLQTVHQSTMREKSTGKPAIDLIRGEFDPFYGADFSVAEKKWVSEAAPKGSKNAPSSSADPAAYLYDASAASPTQQKIFESVPVVPATGEQLGALKWGVRWSKGRGTVLGARSVDCTDQPSAEFRAAVKQFYETPKSIDQKVRRDTGVMHYDAILDEFDTNDATLKERHKKQLDPFAGQFKKFKSLSAKIGGFADATETKPFDISQQRADAVASYLISKGVGSERIKVGGHGATWVRYRPSATENRNRRVQILLYFP